MTSRTYPVRSGTRTHFARTLRGVRVLQRCLSSLLNELPNERHLGRLEGEKDLNADAIATLDDRFFFLRLKSRLDLLVM